VRREQKRGDYSDPGWYGQPPGTAAREVAGAPGDPIRAPQAAHSHDAKNEIEVSVRKPTGHTGH